MEGRDVHPLFEAAAERAVALTRSAVKHVGGALAPGRARDLGDHGVDLLPLVVEKEEANRVEPDAEVARVGEQPHGARRPAPQALSTRSRARLGEGSAGRRRGGRRDASHAGAGRRADQRGIGSSTPGSSSRSSRSSQTGGETSARRRRRDGARPTLVDGRGVAGLRRPPRHAASELAGADRGPRAARWARAARRSGRVRRARARRRPTRRRPRGIPSASRRRSSGCGCAR